MTPAPVRPLVVELRGTGGAVFSYELDQISEHLAAQIARGVLQPVDAESAEALAAAGFHVTR